MKLFTLASILSTSAALVGAQAVFDPTTNTFVCSPPKGAFPLAFCAGDSLATNIIIRCNGIVGQPGNCNDNLAGIPPVGVKTFAPCYQSSPIAGDAACTFNGIVYPAHGSPFPIPSLATTATSSSATTLSTGNITVSLLGTQPVKNISTSVVNTQPTGNLSAQSTSSITPVVPLGYTSYIAGTKIAIPGTRASITPTSIAPEFSSAYNSSGVLHASLDPFARIFTSAPVSPNHESPVSYGPVETPVVPIIVDNANIDNPPLKKGNDIRGSLRYNTTSLASTPAGTGVRPLKSTSPAIAPFSNANRATGASGLFFGVGMLALVNSFM